MSITVILVTYNSAAVVEKAIESVIHDPLVSTIMLSDNASTDGTADMVAQKFMAAKIIKNQENIGFGRGNNVALAQVETPYALLLNPDAVMKEGALAALVRAAELYPQGAIFAPLLKDEQGHVHHSYKRNVWTREKQGSGEFVVPEGPLCAEFLSGAVWFVRMSALKQTWFFDQDLFLYYEDDDLCLRTRAAGFSNIYVPDAEAMHLMGKSTAYDPQHDARRQGWMIESRLKLEKKYKGEIAAAKLAKQIKRTSIMKWLLYSALCNPRKLRYRARMLSSTLPVWDQAIAINTR